MISIAIPDAELYSASAKESATLFCILDLHSTGQLYWAMKPVVDRRERLLPQSEAVQPSSPPTESLRYVSLKLDQCTRYPTRCVNAA